MPSPPDIHAQPPPPGLVDRRHRNRLACLPAPPELAVWVDSYVLWLTGNGKSANTVRIYSDAALRLAERRLDWAYLGRIVGRLARDSGVEHRATRRTTSSTGRSTPCTPTI